MHAHYRACAGQETLNNEGDAATGDLVPEDGGDGCGPPQLGLLHPAASRTGHRAASAGTPIFQEASWHADHVGPLPCGRPGGCLPRNSCVFLVGGCLSRQRGPRLLSYLGL